MFYGQEIALFTGTLRFNLDPKGMFTDDKIWSCVTSFGLLEFVQGLGRRQLMGPEGATAATDSCGSAGLDTEVRPGGSSLSNGEKQLICCLRGLLCKFQDQSDYSIKLLPFNHCNRTPPRRQRDPNPIHISL